MISMQKSLLPHPLWQQAKTLPWLKVACIVTVLMLLTGVTLLTSTVYADEAVHTVVRGESLGTIARSYNVSTRE